MNKKEPIYGYDENDYLVEIDQDKLQPPIKKSKRGVKMSTALEEMIKELDCEHCRDKRMCNGVDLMNCYAKKKLTIKPSKV